MQTIEANKASEKIREKYKIKITESQTAEEGLTIEKIYERAAKEGREIQVRSHNLSRVKNAPDELRGFQTSGFYESNYIEKGTVFFPVFPGTLNWYSVFTEAFAQVFDPSFSGVELTHVLAFLDINNNWFNIYQQYSFGPGFASSRTSVILPVNLSWRSDALNRFYYIDGGFFTVQRSVIAF